MAIVLHLCLCSLPLNFDRMLPWAADSMSLTKTASRICAQPTTVSRVYRPVRHSALRPKCSPSDQDLSCKPATTIVVHRGCSPELLKALMQQHINMLSPKLVGFEIQHQSASGEFITGWPENPQKIFKRQGKLIMRIQGKKYLDGS